MKKLLAFAFVVLSASASAFAGDAGTMGDVSGGRGAGDISGGYLADIQP